MLETGPGEAEAATDSPRAAGERAGAWKNVYGAVVAGPWGGQERERSGRSVMVGQGEEGGVGVLVAHFDLGEGVLPRPVP